MGKANLIWESIDFEFEDRMTSSTFLRKRSHIEFCIRGFSDRRLGGGESIREIVSCRQPGTILTFWCQFGTILNVWRRFGTIQTFWRQFGTILEF